MLERPQSLMTVNPATAVARTNDAHLHASSSAPLVTQSVHSSHDVTDSAHTIDVKHENTAIEMNAYTPPTPSHMNNTNVDDVTTMSSARRDVSEADKARAGGKSIDSEIDFMDDV